MSTSSTLYLHRMNAVSAAVGDPGLSGSQSMPRGAGIMAVVDDRSGEFPYPGFFECSYCRTHFRYGINRL
jgi:hypothetical protein